MDRAVEERLRRSSSLDPHELLHEQHEPASPDSDGPRAVAGNAAAESASAAASSASKPRDRSRSRSMSSEGEQPEFIRPAEARKERQAQKVAEWERAGATANAAGEPSALSKQTEQKPQQQRRKKKPSKKTERRRKSPYNSLSPGYEDALKEQGETLTLAER